MMPTFLGIGAQKCASSWLHQVIASHPAVNVPAVKEVNFFSYHFDHGYQWYERQFHASDAVTQLGEVSPSYFYDLAAPARVREYRPDMKILLALRDPVERALSNHRHELRVGHMLGDDRSFEAGLVNNPMYVEQGFYAKHLENWLRYFPREQVLILLVEDISNDPLRVATDIYRFLGIDESIHPAAIADRRNQSVESRFPTLLRIKKRIYDVTRSPGLGWLWSLASGVGLRRLYRKLNNASTSGQMQSMDSATAAELRERFREDTERLEQILGRDLESWRTGITHNDGESQRLLPTGRDTSWATR